MRILHLVSYSLFSGPMAPTMALALAQRRAGHQVWLAPDSKRGNINGYEEAAMPRLLAADLLPPWRLTLSAKSGPAEMWRDYRALRRVCAAHEIDVVHAHMSHDHALMALAVAETLRVRTIHAARSLDARFAQAALVRRADLWVVRCARHGDTLAHTFAIPKDRIQTILGAIDTARFTVPSAAEKGLARGRFGIPPEATVLGHVALVARRGQEELVDAVASLGEAAPHLVFVGRGEREDALRRRVEAQRLTHRVHFAGYVHGDSLPAVYHAMDAAFVAGAGNDASCRAALEAMACGLPVIALQEHALGEAVTEREGYPFTRRSVDSIRGALDAWLGDREEAARKGARGRDKMLRERQVEREAADTLAAYATQLNRVRASSM